MPEAEISIADRVRRLAAFLTETDAVRVRIERDGEQIEVSRASRGVASVPISVPSDGALVPEPVAANVDAIKADLVGIFRLSRPSPFEGELLDDDRELAFIEALGMRNPVRSLGGGRIVTIAVSDGSPVEYGQALFLVDRG